MKMKIKSEAIIYFVGLASIILLPNHDIFNFLFQGSPLVVWKQFLSVILLGATVSYMFFGISGGEIGLPRRLIASLLVATLFFGAFSIILGLGMLRVAYGAIGYIGFVGGIAFSHVILKKNYFLDILNVFFWLGLFCSVGVIFDYYTPYFDFLPRSGGVGIEEQAANDYLRRASFLFGTSTIVYPFLSFCVISSAMQFLRFHVLIYFLRFLLLAMIAIGAMYLTGSRAGFFLMLTLFGGVLFFVSQAFSNKIKLFFAFFAVFVFPLVIYFALEVFNQGEMADRYSSTFTSDSEGNDHRFYVWQLGMQLFGDFGLVSIIGKGLGSSLGMIDDGYAYTSHFESSIFQSFSEGGVIGLFLRFFPILVMIFVGLYRRRSLAPVEKILFFWVILYFLSVSTSPTAGAYHTQFVYFLVCGLLLSNKTKNIINGGDVDNKFRVSGVSK